MNEKLKKALKIFSSSIVAIVVAFAILTSGVRLFGLKVYTVLSPSMEPKYKTGALIYVKDTAPEKLKVGDVITFMMSEETTVTHRIVGIEPDTAGTLYFRTKGDANKIEDGASVHQDNVLGKPIFNIPYLGYVASFVSHPPGIYLSVAIGLILTILVFMVDYITSEDTKKSNKSTKEH